MLIYVFVGGALAYDSRVDKSTIDWLTKWFSPKGNYTPLSMEAINDFSS